MKNILSMDYESDLQRQRRIDSLMKIVQEELTEFQRDTLIECCLKGRLQTDYAKERGVNKSTVCRTLARAVKKVRRFARYL